MLTARATLKLTWQVTPRNKLSSFTSLNSDDIKNDGDMTVADRDALRTFQNRDLFSGVIWESLLSDSLFLRSQVGIQQRWRDVRPQRCDTDPETCGHITQTRQTSPTTLRFDNYELTQQTVQRSLEVINQLEWFAHSKVFGEHSLKAKSRFFAELWEPARGRRRPAEPADQRAPNGAQAGAAVNLVSLAPRRRPVELLPQPIQVTHRFCWGAK